MPARFVIAGGGTGGHVIPALAIARELRDQHGAEVLFVGTPRGLENRLVPAAGFPLKLVQVGQLKNVSIVTRLKTLFALPASIVAARRIISDFRPNVVIGVGGYASGPAMLAAVLKGVPTLAFEPNVVPGFANRVVARWVSAAAVQFPQTAQHFRNAQVTGVPVRKEFFRFQAKLAAGSPSLLVFGGSQGARVINQAMTAAAPLLLQRVPQLQLVHQTGERDQKEVADAYAGAGLRAQVLPFIDDMPSAFARADLLVCRAGASTVAEATAAGKAAIFIPFARAADDHQRRNAEALAQAGAALLIPESELTPERLADAISTLLNDRSRLEAMSAAARSLAHDDAAQKVAAIAMSLIK